MKRAEREHLKEDPFEQFIANALDKLKQNRKPIIIGLIAVVALLGIVFATYFFMQYAEKKDNRLLNEGMGVVNSIALTPAQKVKELQQLPLTHKGKAAALVLQLANLHIAAGDRAAARKLLDDTPVFSLSLLEDQRQMFNATLLADEGKINEAIDLLQRLLGNKKSTLNRDMLLFRLADYQARAGNRDAAKENYQRLMEEFPQSMFAYQAQQSLEKLN